MRIQAKNNMKLDIQNYIGLLLNRLLLNRGPYPSNKERRHFFLRELPLPNDPAPHFLQPPQWNSGTLRVEGRPGWETLQPEELCFRPRRPDSSDEEVVGTSVGGTPWILGIWCMMSIGPRPRLPKSLDHGFVHRLRNEQPFADMNANHVLSVLLGDINMTFLRQHNNEGYIEYSTHNIWYTHEHKLHKQKFERKNTQIKTRINVHK